MQTYSMNNFYDDDFPDYFLSGGNFHIKSKLMITYPLNYYSARGDLIYVKDLIARGVNVNSLGDMGYTPLHEASENGHCEVVTLLIENKANINAINDFSKKAIDIAREKGFFEIVEIIEKACNDEMSATAYDYCSDERETLPNLIRLGKAADVEVFLKCMGGVNEKEDDDWGMTPLHISAGIGNLEIIKILLNYGANPNLKNLLGYSAIDVAHYSGDVEIINYLYEWTTASGNQFHE